jgi:hypothetical protein
MMTITPPPELVQQWARFQGDTDPEALWFRIATEAAQYGADQELEACCEVITSQILTCVGAHVVPELRAALAEPQPEGPSGDEIYKLALEGDFLVDVGDGFTCMVQDEVEFARAVLARWGNS